MKQAFFFITVMVALLLTSCGPSEQEVATMTASAWTPTPSPTSTPSPTPTATPIPYDLTVKVTGVEGDPVPRASVVLDGDEGPVLTGQSGDASWTDLPASDGSLEVSAQGYRDSSQDFSLSRGPNELSIALEHDPFGLLPSEACAPGERPFYIEDFEDKSVTGWPDIEFAAQGFAYTSDPENPENSVLQMQDPAGSGRGDFPANMAWRFHFQFVVFTSLNLTVGQGANESGEWFYQVIVSPPGADNASHMRRIQHDSNVGVRNLPTASIGEWHLLEVGRYDDTITVWLDGQFAAEYQDAMPLPSPGFFGVNVLSYAEPGTVLLDNMSVCELSSSLQPLATATPINE